MAVYALYTGNKELAGEYVKRVFEQRLPKQVEVSGAQPDELARTRPLHYSLFNLEAYFYTARVADHLGLDMWNYTTKDGVGIKTMIDFLVPAINKQGYWETVKDSKTRRGRLFYFLNMAHQQYGDPKYLRAIQDLIPLIEQEDRAELSQCLLISPTPSGITLPSLLAMDPDGSKSGYRCYY